MLSLCHFLTLQLPFCPSVALYSLIDSPREAICGPLLWRISYKNKLYYAVWEINLIGETAADSSFVQTSSKQNPTSCSMWVLWELRSAALLPTHYPTENHVLGGKGGSTVVKGAGVGEMLCPKADALIMMLLLPQACVETWENKICSV